MTVDFKGVRVMAAIRSNNKFCCKVFLRYDPRAERPNIAAWIQTSKKLDYYPQKGDIINAIGCIALDMGRAEHYREVTTHVINFALLKDSGTFEYVTSPDAREPIKAPEKMWHIVEIKDYNNIKETILTNGYDSVTVGDLLLSVSSEKIPFALTKAYNGGLDPDMAQEALTRVATKADPKFLKDNFGLEIDGSKEASQPKGDGDFDWDEEFN